MAYKGFLMVAALENFIKYRVVHVNFISGEATSDNGRPTGQLKGSEISMVMLDAPDDFLKRWAVNPAMYKSGCVVIEKDNYINLDKHTLEFENARLVSFGMVFEEGDKGSDGGASFQTALTISAERITFPGIGTYDNKWNIK